MEPKYYAFRMWFDTLIIIWEYNWMPRESNGKHFAIWLQWQPAGATFCGSKDPQTQGDISLDNKDQRKKKETPVEAEHFKNCDIKSVCVTLISQRIHVWYIYLHLA